jgi:CRISPR/Cas system-associated exonuclease Cas4 (RecB family)
MTQHPLANVVDDVYELLRHPGNYDIKEEQVSDLGLRIAKAIAKQFSKEEEKERTYIWPSQLGTPCDRKVWYHHNPDVRELPPHPWTRIKFMQGDIAEEIALALVEWTGKHEVTERQGYVEWKDKDGRILLRGKKDAKINGIPVEIKAQADMAYTRTATGKLLEEDPFGYIVQLRSYILEEDQEQGGAILAINRTMGHMHILPVPAHNLPEIRERIEHLTRVLDNREVEPDRVYEDEPDGYTHKEKGFIPNGNRVLGLACQYCPFRYHCWRDSNDGKGLRTFKSSRGPVYFTKVVKEPKMQEVHTNGDGSQ